ncbi:MAG TPA: hypothetical protein VG796_07945 [Verrucomicrobiales bacterium]|nr:hypothetical protein [Verrucomicrobiales bacterium]
MDVHCTTCGEPWDTYHLWHDAIWETGMKEEEIRGWLKLHTRDQLSDRFRDEFRAVGWEFGRTIVNVIRCPCCPANAEPDPERLFIKAEIEALLVEDEDALATQYSELGL